MTGIVNENVLPAPCWLSTQILPPCASTRTLILGDPRTIVGHREHQLAGSGRHPDLDVAAVGAELDRISDQVDERLHHTSVIAPDRGRVGPDVDRERDLLERRGRGDHVGGFREHPLDREDPGVDRRGLEQILHQPLHHRDGPRDRLDLTTTHRIQGRIGARQDPGRELDVRQRVAEIVRHHREQVLARGDGGAHLVGQAGRVQRQPGTRRDQLQGPLVARRELVALALVRQVEMAFRRGVAGNHDPEEAPHLGVRPWMAAEPGAGAEIAQADRAAGANDLTE